MQKIALISRKGGSGKTTLAIHLALEAVKAGKLTLLIDLDPQASATEWYDMREAGPEFVTMRARPVDIPDILKRAKASGADLVLMDTPPHTDKTTLAAAQAADLILVPCRPSALDLKAISGTFNLLDHVADIPAKVVINNGPPVGSRATAAQEQLKAAGYPVCSAIVAQRVALAYALDDGRAINEYDPNGKAAAEIKTLWETIQEKKAND